MFLIDIYGLFLFGLVKLIFRLPKSEEYLPKGLPGTLKFASPDEVHLGMLYLNSIQWPFLNMRS